jgi:tetraacyldisaccharide 4'-kinase
MLARALPGVPVLVGADRFLSGSIAERELGVTVHVLDDGFQHVKLARTVDLLLVDESDLTDRVLPAGRLREPLSSAVHADAALVTSIDDAGVARVAGALGLACVFRITRAVQAPRSLTREPMTLDKNARVFAVAGIARPERFFTDLSSGGWQVVGQETFADHHAFGPRDIARLAERSGAAGASVVLTTEKDAVRLEGLDLRGLVVAYVPLTSRIEPADRFAGWLFDRLRAHLAHGTSVAAAGTPPIAHRTSDPTPSRPPR